MKKVFLLSLITGLVFITSCKKETAETVTDKIENVADELDTKVNEGEESVSDVTTSVVDDLPEVPEMEDAGLQEWVNKLKDVAVKAKEAALSGDIVALKIATEEITTLSESLKNFKDSPEFAKAKEYYDVISSKLTNL